MERSSVSVCLCAMENNPNGPVRWYVICSSQQFDFGNGPRKPIPMDCHCLSGTGRLWSKPLDLLFIFLDVAQVLHDMQKFSMSCAIEVHQKYHLMYCTVLNWLKCPIIECTWLMMIAISHLPFTKASRGIHSTSCFNWFLVNTKPSLQPNKAWAFGFSNILEYSLSFL